MTGPRLDEITKEQATKLADAGFGHLVTRKKVYKYFVPAISKTNGAAQRVSMGVHQKIRAEYIIVKVRKPAFMYKGNSEMLLCVSETISKMYNSSSEVRAYGISKDVLIDAIMAEHGLKRNQVQSTIKQLKRAYNYIREYHAETGDKIE